MRRTIRGRKPAVFSRVKILYEDEAVIVVDKPAGLLTIATERERERTLYAWLFDHVKHRRPPEKLFIVHRLDREASGLLVFAKTPEAKEFLQQQYANRTAGRIYKAVVEGRVSEDSRTITSLLTENRAHRSYSTENPRLGKQAITHVRVVKRSSAGRSWKSNSGADESTRSASTWPSGDTRSSAIESTEAPTPGLVASLYTPSGSFSSTR